MTISLGNVWVERQYPNEDDWDEDIWDSVQVLQCNGISISLKRFKRCFEEQVPNFWLCYTRLAKSIKFAVNRLEQVTLDVSIEQAANEMTKEI